MALFGAIPPLSDLCDKGNDTGSGVSFGICSTEDYIRGGRRAQPRAIHTWRTPFSEPSLSARWRNLDNMTWTPGYNPMATQSQPQLGLKQPEQLPRLASETTADNPWPVSMLSEKFHMAVERWPSVWVAGQITQINTRRAGSAYLTLRDDYQDIAMEVNGFGQFAAAVCAGRSCDHPRQAESVDETHVAFAQR